MADSQVAFRFVMGHEDPTLSGRVVIDDNGGKARFGVNSKDNPQAEADGFYEMPTDDALVYAHKVFVGKYWSAVKGDELVDQRVANQCADLYFVSGDEAVLIMQRAVNRRAVSPIVVDGKMGPQTLNALNVCTATYPDATLDAIKAQAVVFFQKLRQQKPEEYTEQIYKSWVGRLNA